MKKVSVILASLLVSLFFTSCSLNKPVSKNAKVTNEAVSTGKITVYQRIIINGSKVPEYAKLEINEGRTALHLLLGLAGTKITGEGANAYVTKIGNREASEKDREFWALYINGKMANSGAGSLILKDQDKIEWKIQKY